MQIHSLILFSWYKIWGSQFVKNSQQCHKVTGYELYFCLYFCLCFRLLSLCAFSISFIFIVAKVVFTCEDVKSDGSRFEDGGFASVVARVRRTGVPKIVMIMIIFAFNYLYVAALDWLNLSTLISNFILTGTKRQDHQNFVDN